MTIIECSESYKNYFIIHSKFKFSPMLPVRAPTIPLYKFLEFHQPNHNCTKLSEQVAIANILTKREEERKLLILKKIIR